MQEKLISFETAKLAKEKGFELNEYMRIDDENPKNLNSNYNPRDYQPWYLDLTQSLLQKWLRDKHKIHIEIRFIDDFIKFNYIVVTMNNNTEVYSEINESYEEALEFGLLKALEII